MRILTLSDLYYPHNPGGAQEVARRLTLGFRNCGHEVAVVCSHDPSSKAVDTYEETTIFSIAQQAGLSQLAGGFEAPETTAQIIEAFNDFSPDIIHAHNVHSALGWAWISKAKEKGIKIMMTFHDHMAVSQGKLIPEIHAGPRETIKQTFFKEFLRYRRSYVFGRRKKIINAVKKCDQLTAVSVDLAKQLRANGLPEMKVILNGADVSQDAPVEISSEPTLFFLSRPTAEKGLHVLMKALEASENNWKLIVAGNVSDSQKEYCRRLAPSIVPEYTGWISGEEKKKYIDASWAICNLSIYPDPCPLSNYEPMARARPVLGTLWGGSPEVLQNGEEAWLLDPRNSAALQKALNEIYKNPQEVTRRGQNAYKKILKQFQWAQITESYLKYLLGKPIKT